MFVVVMLLAACGRASAPSSLHIPGADPERGRRLVVDYGCHTCHSIEGIPPTPGAVGPPLENFGRQSLIGGTLPNVPRHLVPWLLDPAAFDPRTGMPDVGLSEQEARDVAAFLYRTAPDADASAYVWRTQLPNQLARERRELLDTDPPIASIDRAMRAYAEKRLALME